MIDSLINWKEAKEKRFRIKRKGIASPIEIVVLKVRLDGTSVLIENISGKSEWLLIQDILEAEPLD